MMTKSPGKTTLAEGAACQSQRGLSISCKEW